MNNIWSSELYSKLLEASKNFNIHREINRCVKPIDKTLLHKEMDKISSYIKLGNYDKALKVIIESSQTIRSKRYINQQLAPTAIAGAFASFWSSLLNQGHAVFEMSPLMSLVDFQIMEWAKKKIGLPKNSFGITTNGGSISNLTALNTARNYLTNFATWNGKDCDLFLWKSEFAHYSIERSAQIMGLPNKSLQNIPVNNFGEIDEDKLLTIFKSKKDYINKKHIFVYTFGNTYNGAFDDLSSLIPLIDLIGRENIWIHIDAAHGGSFFHHDEFKKYFKLLERNMDSFIWNPHKLFFQPIPLSILFFKNKSVASYSSSHVSPYLSQNVNDDIYFDAHKYTLECSRTSLGFKLWLTLQIHDVEEIYKIHHRIFRLANYFVDKLVKSNYFEIFHYSKNNIICFKYRNNSINIDEVIKCLQDVGWGLGTVNIKNEKYIRVTFMDDNLFYSDLDDLIDNLCSIANY